MQSRRRRVAVKSPRSKKLIVSWGIRSKGTYAEFAFGDTEIEAAAMFALRYAINLGEITHVEHQGRDILHFDGRTLSRLPKSPPIKTATGPELQREAAARKNKRIVKIKRRKR